MNKPVIYTDTNDELLNSYLKEISKYKILDSSEVAILISKAQQGDEKARDKVITSNLRFVVTIAKRYQNRGISLMDLISAGVEGLIKSISKYDPDKGTVFLTYAGWWVKQCIYNTIYSHGDLIRLPISQRLLVIKILDTTNEYVQKYSRNPSAEELSELTLYDVEEIKLKDKKLVLSNLDKMLNVLSDREHDLIRMYFGIGMDPVDPDYISNMFGVGRERIRQMKESALGKLKKKFAKQLKGLLE